MKIDLIIDNYYVKVENVRFSDGSSNLKIIDPGIKDPTYVTIHVHSEGMEADNCLWEIMKLVDAVDRKYPRIQNKELQLDYLPHARADRVFEDGNCLPLDVFFYAIGNLGWFTGLILIDPHSDYYKNFEYLFDDITVLNQHAIVPHQLIESGDVLVSPDKGSVDKVKKLQQSLDFGFRKSTHVCIANKTRDVSTGKIVDTTLTSTTDLQGKVCWIIDDICDGGGTFIPLAEKLKQNGAIKVNLFVSHGIFSKGLDIFKGIIDNLYPYQLVANYVTQEDINNFNSQD